MSLRQIIREQKLSNFNYNLRDFIFEADDDEKVTKKDAFAGKTDAKVPKDKYWFVKPGEKPRDRVNSPGAGWKLADKDEAREAEETKKDIEAIDDELRDNINQEMGGLNLEPQPEDENSFVDKEGDEIFQIGSDGKIQPGGGIGKFKAPEGEPYADYIDDLNDRLHGDDEPAQDAEDDEERIEEPTDTKSRPRRQGEITKESINAIDGKQKLLALKLKAKAPGNPSSAINEIMIGDGMVMFSDNPDKPVEDVAEELFESIKKNFLYFL